MDEMTLFELTKALINIPSVTGEESEIADFLESFLKSEGFYLKTQKVEGNRKNILATTGSTPRVVLCTHLDTVPPYFAASEDDIYIHGRGACDAKGIMASMIWAAQELRGSVLNKIGLLFVVGEETDSIGAKMANALDVGSQFIVVGEPTENKLGLGHNGVVMFRLTARGKAAHSAYPQLGVSAIDKLLDALKKVRSLDFCEDPVLGKSVLNIGTIEGGTAANIISDHANAEVNVRSALATAQILEMVEVAVGPNVEIQVQTRSEPQKLFTVPGIEQTVVPFGTDIPHLKNLGKPLLLGPGSGLLAHTKEERIEKRQLSEAVTIYKNLVKMLLELKGGSNPGRPTNSSDSNIRK